MLKQTWIGTCWRHQMETFSVVLALCAGNSPVTGEFPSQKPVTRSFDLFLDLRLNKRFTGTGEFPAQMVSSAENVFIWWRHHEQLRVPQHKDYFTSTSENEAKQCFCNYARIVSRQKYMALNIIIGNFTTQETDECIHCVPSTAVNGILVELSKACNEKLSEWVPQVLSCIIIQRNFPESWCEGLHSSIYKAGDRLFSDSQDSYKGVTILPIVESYSKWQFIMAILCQWRLQQHWPV